MKQSLALIALVIRDYDEAIDFYTRVLDFTLVEDTFQLEQNKHWVVVSPPGQPNRICCWPALRTTSSVLTWATKPAAACFCSCTPTTSTATTTVTASPA